MKFRADTRNRIGSPVEYMNVTHVKAMIYARRKSNMKSVPI